MSHKVVQQTRMQVCYWLTFVIGVVLSFHIDTRLSIAWHITTDQMPQPKALTELMAMSDLGAVVVVSGLFTWLATGFHIRGRLYQDRLTWANFGMMGLMIITIIGNILYPASSPWFFDVTWTVSWLGVPILIIIDDTVIAKNQNYQAYYLGALSGVLYIVLISLVFYTSTM